MKNRYITQKNTSTLGVVDLNQKWVVWFIDEYGDWWTQAFFPTRRQARLHASNMNRTLK